jgi:hypothetical protein
MGFLSESDLSEFRNAIKQTTDTFCQIPIIYHKKKRVFDRFNEDQKPEEENYNLNGLLVYDSKGISSQSTQDGSLGKYDNAEGYVLLNYEDLIAANMIDSDGKFIGNQSEDELTFQGIRVEILGIPLIGQLVNQFSVIKIWFKKNIR